ncbi:MAG TPA: AAA family ATPase [Casimicrobiaceae bacterium]|nr:AAA family ATPase [Casimicrobiaceae bacterium]
MGREWVFARVRRFLAGPPCVFLLCGDPGTGKTAVAARLAQDSSGHGAIENRMAGPAIGEGTISAAVFCRAGRADVVELTQRLSDQLAESVEGFGDQRLSLLAPAIKVGDVHVATGDVEAGASVAGVLINVGDERAFGQRVATPLRRLRDRGATQRVVLLVDALDEATSLSGSHMLSRQLAKLDGVLRYRDAHRLRSTPLP